MSIKDVLRDYHYKTEFGKHMLYFSILTQKSVFQILHVWSVADGYVFTFSDTNCVLYIKGVGLRETGLVHFFLQAHSFVAHISWIEEILL